MGAMAAQAAGLICLLYYFVIVIYAGITADFAWFWAAAGLLLSLCGFWLRRYGESLQILPVWIRYSVPVILVTGSVLFLSLLGKIIGGMNRQGNISEGYVIVLGAHVKGDVPSKALKIRLDQALSYAMEHEHVTLILTGGQGSGEDITEAECMRRYLTERGIDETRMVLEDRSTTTRENLAFADRLTGCSQHLTGIISNNFHIYRAVSMAEHMGYRNVEGIAAPSDPVMQVHYVVREVFALIKAVLKGDL